MTAPDLVTVTITGPTVELLAEILHVLIDRHLAACGNIIPRVTSMYRWEGVIKQETEALVLIHTRRTLLPRLERTVTELHPYDVPQIVALPVETTYPYGTWVREVTS